MRVKFLGWSVVGVAVMVALALLLTGAVFGPTSAPLAAESRGGAEKAGSTAEFKVHGMHCTLCAANLGRILEEQPGVAAARVDFENKVAIVEFDAKQTTVDRIATTIEETGVFRAELVPRPGTQGE